MKITRIRHVKKTLRFYSVNFQLKEPYHVLCDGTFIAHVVRAHQSLNKILEAVFTRYKFVPYTVPQVLDELRKLKLTEALQTAKKLKLQRPVIPCDTPNDAILSLVKEPSLPKGQFYIVATKDKELLQAVREIPRAIGLNIYHLNPILDSPTQIAMEHVKKQQRIAFGATSLTPNAMNVTDTIDSEVQLKED
ncbi:Fcf1 pre-rRNA processing protein [Giardia muris]|uniref:Fcf1 pre-rRNA processing protein n=1 Tax=Giardia muris TaxID=5742 RepID=A0A4Z1T506_GIAMU|nr:Fcf1 pre-rRNA processing protein [Giardia muris]|eukprot:TNJ28167.1 Fcf1 pre-rRNA processing protein [Giardia muris]